MQAAKAACSAGDEESARSCYKGNRNRSLEQGALAPCFMGDAGVNTKIRGSLFRLEEHPGLP